MSEAALGLHPVTALFAAAVTMLVAVAGWLTNWDAQAQAFLQVSSQQTGEVRLLKPMATAATWAIVGCLSLMAVDNAFGAGQASLIGDAVPAALLSVLPAAMCVGLVSVVAIILDMLISHVKRLLLATWCSNLGDQAKPPVDVAAGIQRLWHETWLKCSGRSLDEGSTLRASNIGADATIDLQVCCPPLLRHSLSRIVSPSSFPMSPNSVVHVQTTGPVSRRRNLHEYDV